MQVGLVQRTSRKAPTFPCNRVPKPQCQENAQGAEACEPVCR